MLVRFFLLLIACTVMAATPFAAPAKQAARADYTLHYAVYGGGLHPIDARIHVRLTPHTYQAELNADTIGFFRRLVVWGNDLKTTGRIHKNQLLPASHRATDQWRDRIRTNVLSYNKNGVFTDWHIEPSAADDNREVVDKKLTTGTVDIMTAALKILKQVADGKTCDAVIPVFDGRRRFNIHAVDKGDDTITDSRYSIYAGPATQCDLTAERIAGYWKKQQTQLTEDGDAQMVVSIWLAPLKPNGYAVPVKIRATGQFGTFYAHLTNADVTP